MSDSRVFSLPIVIRFDVLEDTGLRHAPSQVSFAMNQFDFQRVKKTLRYGVVVTGRSSPHATAQAVVLYQPLIAL